MRVLPQCRARSGAINSAGTNLLNNGINFDLANQKLYYALGSTSGNPLGMFRINPDGTGNQFILNDGDGFNYIEVLNPSAVPEPLSLVMLGTGILAVLGYVWHRHR